MSSEESETKSESNILVSYGEEESLSNFLSYLFKKKTDVFGDKKRTKGIGSGFVRSHYRIKYRKEYISFTFLEKNGEGGIDERSEEEKEEDDKKSYNLYLYLKMFCKKDDFDADELKIVTENVNLKIDTSLVLLFVSSPEEEEEYDDFEEENLLIVNLEKKKITRRKLLRNFLKFISMKEEEMKESEQFEEENEKEKKVEPTSSDSTETFPSQSEEGPAPPKSGEKLDGLIEERNKENEEMIKKLQEDLELIRQEKEEIKEKAERHEDDAFALKRKLRKLKKKKVEYKCNSLKYENEFDSLRKQKVEDDQVFRKIESEKIILESLRKTDEDKFKKELEELRMHLKEKDVVLEELSQQKNELITKLEEKEEEEEEETEINTAGGKKKKVGGKKLKSSSRGIKKKTTRKVGGLGKKRHSLQPNSSLFRKSRTLRAGDLVSPFNIKKSSKGRYGSRKLYEPGYRFTRTKKRIRTTDDINSSSSSSSSSSSNKTSSTTTTKGRVILSPRAVANQQKMKFLKNRKKKKSLQSYKIENEKLSLRIKEIQQEVSMKEKNITLLKLQLKNEKRMKKNNEIQIRKLKNLLLKKNETISYLRLKISKM